MATDHICDPPIIYDTLSVECSNMPTDEAITSAIQNILGNSPKSSLLFGAPALSVRQVHASLESSSPALTSQDILVAAAQAAEKVFQGSKHAQLKKLMRGGTEEEWIVFRPTLAVSAPARNVGSGSSQLMSGMGTEVHNVLPSPSPKTDWGQRGIRGGADNVSGQSDSHNLQNIELQPIASEQAKEKTITSKLFRPFLKTKPSKDSTSLSPYKSTGPHVVLPPAHRIGSADFGSTILPVTAVEDVASDLASKHPTRTGFSRSIAPTFKRPPARSESERAAEVIQSSECGAALTTRKSHNTAPRSTSTAQTYAPVDIDKPYSFAQEIEQGSAPSSLPYLSTPSDISGSPHTDFSLPREREPDSIIVSVGSVTQDRSNEPDSVSANQPVQPYRPHPLKLHASTPKSTRDVRLSPESSTSSQSSLSATSSSSASSIATSSLLTPGYFSNPPSPSSPISPDRPTPWLSVVFQDLPFGPDVPAFHLIKWAKDRYRLVCVEMMVVLGAVYIIQIAGM